MEVFMKVMASIWLCCC